MPNNTNTYYDILGVSETASEAEITAAYRSKAKEHHPDRSDHPNAEQQFKQLKTAKEVLTDPTERTAYDRTTHTEYIQSTRNSSIIAGSPHTPNTNTQNTNSPPAKSTANTDTPTHQTTTPEQSPNTTTAYAKTIPRGIFDRNITTGTSLRWLVSLFKQLAFGTRWIVETLWQSVIAIPYGIVAFTISLFFLAGVTYPTALYVTIPFAICFLGIWAYMIMDWRLGVGGFGSVSLVLGLGHNIGFIPGGNGFQLIMTALLAGLILSFIMKLNYAIRGTSPPSVMDALAGWNLDNTDTEQTN